MIQFCVGFPVYASVLSNVLTVCWPCEIMSYEINFSWIVNILNIVSATLKFIDYNVAMTFILIIIIIIVEY